MGQQRLQVQAPIEAHLLQQIDAPDRRLDGRQPIPRQQLLQVARQLLEEPDDVLRLAPELGPQLRLLRRNARRTGVQMALPRHVAPQHHQHRRAEGVLIRPEQCAATSTSRAVARSAIGPQPDAPAHAVLHQHLLRLGQAKLPRVARVLDARQRRRARSARVPGDHDEVGIGLSHTRRYRAHAAARHQLHADRRTRIDPLQVEDKLRQVLDGVDVVVRRRRDQRHARLRVTQPRDQPAHLEARQLPALARLRALRHLDLDLLGVGQILRRHSEAPRSHLLDLVVQQQRLARSAPSTIGSATATEPEIRACIPLGPSGSTSTWLTRHRLELVDIAVLAAFARVRAAAKDVHGHRDRAVRLRAKRAERHRARDELLDQALRRLDRLQRQLRSSRANLHQIAQHRRVPVRSHRASRS